MVTLIHPTVPPTQGEELEREVIPGPPVLFDGDISENYIDNATQEKEDLPVVAPTSNQVLETLVEKGPEQNSVISASHEILSAIRERTSIKKSLSSPLSLGRVCPAGRHETFPGHVLAVP